MSAGAPFAPAAGKTYPLRSGLWTSFSGSSAHIRLQTRISSSPSPSAVLGSWLSAPWPTLGLENTSGIGSPRSPW